MMYDVFKLSLAVVLVLVLVLATLRWPPPGDDEPYDPFLTF